jgi:hypothetical protein
MHLVELSRQEHATLKIDPDRAEASAATQHLIPIVASEFRRAATQYPIVFAKNPQTGRFGAFVLSGLRPQENLFWTGTKLEAAYVPLNVRRGPFFVGMADGPTVAGESVLCLDMDSVCITASGRQSLVEADGSDSPYLKKILAILSELLRGQQQTAWLIDELLSLELLCPTVLDVVLGDGKPFQLEGLYSIDEERFRSLNTSDVERVWSAGLMELIYSVVISTGQISNLIRLRNERELLNRAWHEPEQ